jgi:nucleotide-binding universal stress UspA family protein
MNTAKNILLASHGTMGARAAEQFVFNLCSNENNVTHLYVIPEFWKHMLGDDWLNNQITRERYCRYLESELEREADKNITRVKKSLQKLNANINSLIIFGNPHKSLIEVCNNHSYDLVVTGSPRPKHLSGLRSRMTSKTLAKKLSSALIQIPYPHIVN